MSNFNTMKTAAVACYTLRDEVRTAIDHLQSHIPVIWIESGLHNNPDKLRQAIQKQIDNLENVENILLVFGACGNSLLDICSRKAQLILPRVDDCISLLLGGNDIRKKLEQEAASYYLTRGYLKNESNIWSEYAYSLEKFGKEKTDQIFRTMLAHYKKLRILDTEAYEVGDIIPETMEIAETLGLTHEVIPGSLKILYKAFRGEWDSDFIIIEKNATITLESLGFHSLSQ